MGECDPLLGGVGSPSSSRSNQLPTTGNIGKFILKEGPLVVAITGPLIVRGFGQYSMNLISMNYVNREAPQHLAGVTLGMSLTTIMGWAAISGLSTALTTLASQAHGASQIGGVGVPEDFMNAALLTHVLWTLVPLSLVPLLPAFLDSIGQDPVVSTDAVTYLLLSTLTFPFYAIFISYRRMLESLLRPWPGALICGSGIFLLFGLLRVVGKVVSPQNSPPLSMGLLFAIFAIVLSRELGPINQVPMLPSLQKLKSYARLALPAMLAMMAEWWSSEVLVIAAGRLNRTQLTANAVTNTLLTVLYQVSYALCISCTVRVGHWLGSKYPKRAKQTVLLHLLIALCISTVASYSIVIYKDELSQWLVGYSEDPATVILTSSLMIPVSRFYVLTTLQAVLNGAMCGAGLQEVSFYCTTIAYWICGVPFGLYLGFYCDMGVHGFWTGMILGCCVNLIITSSSLVYINLGEVKPRHECDV